MSICLIAGGVEWHQGAVVLSTNNVVLVGEISFESTYDLILFRTSKSITVYPAYRLKSFQYFDEAANINRKFVSLPVHEISIQKHYLYELVVRGKISVLRKAKKILKAHSYNDQYDFDYYILNDENLMDISKFKSYVFPVMLNDRHAMIVAYVREHHLDVNHSTAAIQLIKYYNRLKDNPELAAGI